jgi:hypothetical protein
MGIKRIVDTSFWTDGKVDEFSPEDKYFMLYLLTNPFSTQLGIYEISIKQVAFQLGYSPDAVNVLIERFEAKYGIIVYSPNTKEIAIKNFLRHSIIKGGAPVRDCLIKEIKRVKDKSLIAQVFAHIKDSEDLNETVRKIISEYEEKNGALNYSNEKQNDNENENDNEVSYPVSCDDTYDDTLNESFKEQPKPPAEKKGEKKTAPGKPPKHKYGEYQHVLLSDEEKTKLTEKYGFELTGKAITFLDEYIEETGYKRKSHYLSIRRWVIDAVKEKEQKQYENGKATNGRKEIVPKWCTESADDAMSKAEERAEKRAVGLDDAYRERVEKLKRELGTKGSG